MTALIAKLTLIIGLHLAITVIWQKRTGAAWSVLIFALVAFVVHYLARIPLREQIAPLLGLQAGPAHWGVPAEVWGLPVMVWGIPTFLIPRYLFFGLFREAVRWLTFRYVATSVQSWRDGVLFGIGYTCFAMLLRLWTLLSEQTVEPGLVPPSLIARIMILKDDFLWEQALSLTWQYGVSNMIFNVGTSLAVLFSVRRRQVWPLLIAALLHVLIPVAVWLSVIHVPSPQLEWPWRLWFFIAWRESAAFIAVLPALLLTFLLRRPLDRPGTS